jgi:hypothetical protein
MHRKLLLPAGLSLVFWATGCCLCDAPYDYCGPTFLGGPCEECVTDARMNSVFDPYPGPLGGEVIHEGPYQHSVLDAAGPQPVPPPADQSPDVDAPMSPPGPPPGPSPLPPSTTQAPRGRSIKIER